MQSCQVELVEFLEPVFSVISEADVIQWGGVVAEMFRGLQTRRRSVGGGSGTFFPGQKPSIRFRAAQNTARVHSETHISQDATEKELFFAENKYFPQITRIP